jgi:hypothetical protein
MICKVGHECNTFSTFSVFSLNLCARISHVNGLHTGLHVCMYIDVYIFILMCSYTCVPSNRKKKIFWKNVLEFMTGYLQHNFHFKIMIKLISSCQLEKYLLKYVFVVFLYHPFRFEFTCFFISQVIRCVLPFFIF